MDIERQIFVEDKEAMKKMEEQIEQEKRSITKNFEKQKAALAAKVEIAEEDRQKILAELEAQNQLQQKEKSEQ